MKNMWAVLANATHTRQTVSSGGFTVVEIVVVLAVMTILLTIGVVGVRGIDKDGRDVERNADVTSIARHFEALYDKAPSTCFGTVCNGNGYPVSSDMIQNNAAQIFADLSNTALRSPGNNDATATSIVMATNTTQTTAGVTPQPTADQYVLQPLVYSSGNWSLCTTGLCRKFNLYYRNEADNAVVRVASKRQ